MGTSNETASTKRKYLDVLMKQNGKRSVAAYVTNERAKGTSWAKIATEIRVITGEHISHPSLIAWFPDLTEVAE